MITYNEKEKTLTASNGGYSREGLAITDTYVRISRDLYGMLYRPVLAVPQSRIGILVMHSAEDYTDMNLCAEMAKRGFTVLGSRVGRASSPLDQKLLDVQIALNVLKAVPGVEKTVLMGHSGGATLMSAYQRVAENGTASVQGSEMLYSAQIGKELCPADGCMFIDSNYGNGSMTLISIDPCVMKEGSGMKLNPQYDPFSPENGFDPSGAAYTPEFLSAFFAAQAERNNRIIRTALDRLTLLQQGKGYYRDDEPFCVAGAGQIKPFNKLINQDLHLLAHTKQAHTLLHADGSTTQEIIPCLRTVFPMRADSSGMFSTYVGTVRAYLSEQSVWALDSYAFTEDGVQGVDWAHTFNCTPGNAAHIHAPVLAVGMTGSYEYAAAELIYDACPSTDKTIAFVEGADHMLSANRRAEKFPGQFGDTEKVLYDYMAQWLNGSRF